MSAWGRKLTLGQGQLGPIPDGRVTSVFAVRVGPPFQPKVIAMLMSLAFAIVTMIVVLTSQAALKLARTPLRYG